MVYFFFFQAEDGIRDKLVTGVQTCALPISVSNDWVGSSDCEKSTRAVIESTNVAWRRRGGVVSCGNMYNATFVLESTVTMRSEERRVGKECRSRWSPYH